MTREHRAWEMLIQRLDYLNTFGGDGWEATDDRRLEQEVLDGRM